MNPKPDKVIPALYGGIIMALVSNIPFLSIVNCLCCAGILLGGFLAVFFYKNNFTPDTPPFTSGDCIGVGAFAGVFGAVFGTLLSALFMSLFGNIFLKQVLDILENMNIQLPEEAMRGIEESMNEGFQIVSMVWSLLANLVIYPVFGLLGGLIGYNVYKPKHQVMMPPPPPPAQPM